MAIYLCATCGRQANKAACSKQEGHMSLGKWHCDKCGKTKVKVQQK